MGNNLLFVHKSTAITEYPRDIADLAKLAMHQLVDEQNINYELLSNFIDQAGTFHKYKMLDIFTNLDSVLIHEFDFDFENLDSGSITSSIDDLKLQVPVEFSFCISAPQKALISRFLDNYGSSNVGIGRILSRVYVKKLFRTVESDISNTRTIAGKRFEPTVISGLQN